VKRPPAGTPEKPVFDEGAFQQLLSAAFVLQQHKERAESSGQPESAVGRVLTQVGEVQEQIRNYRLDLQAAATLIARRVREVTEASGAAVGILQGKDLEYFAATGSASGELGARAPFDLSLAAECLRTGLVLRSPDAERDRRLRSELCRPLHIRGLIAAPILFEAKVVGVLELHFAQPNSFQDQEVRTCQLLAALLSEAYARENELQTGSVRPQQAAAQVSESPENASVRAALEKIKPQLERLAAADADPNTPSAASAQSAVSTPVCSSCGHLLTGDDSFCNFCGTSRNAPSTWSSLWNLQREAERSGTLPEHADLGDASDGLEVLPSELEDIVSQFSVEPCAPARQVPEVSSPVASAPPQAEITRSNGNGAAARVAPQPLPSSYSHPHVDSYSLGEEQFSAQTDSLFPTFAPEIPAPPQRPAQPPQMPASTQPIPALPAQSSDAAWTSAAKTREWLEKEHGGVWLARKWKRQRANIYIAVSAALLVVALLDWGTLQPASPAAASNSRPTAAAGKNPRTKTPPKPELSFAEQLLVQLGLAEAPSAPAYTGNPDVKVWVDVHTALYHCPGSDLYGKTPGGKFTTQGDAQQDNFQPATRRACD